MRSFLLLIYLFTAQAQAHQSTTRAQKIRIQLEDRSNCQELIPYFWIALHQAVLDGAELVSWSELRQSFRLSRDQNIQKLEPILQVLEKHLGNAFWHKFKYEKLEILAQLELGVDVRKEIFEATQELRLLKSKLQFRLTKKCLQSEVPTRDASQTNLARGAKKLMSIAYQSCEAPRLSPLDSVTQPMKGVSIIGNHPDQIEKVRKITDLLLVQQTHPYLRIQNHELGCHPVNQKPLIYDYGGKPSYRLAEGFELDLFKNAGSGGSELGIDCSAVIITSLGLEGLRLKPNEDVTARNTAAFGTTQLIRSPDYFPCLEYVGIGANSWPLQSGDIVTVKGHTLIIDDIGPDPLGVERFTTENACSQVSTDRFDFQVLHSSPGVGSVGINRMQARDYLKTSAKVSAGLLKYAQNHCLLKIKNQSLKPKYPDVSIVRHKKTHECLGRSFVLERQSCVQNCL